jgi:glucan phosphoethanolaminetransferase (alkaline phosphatase superfamily)
MAQTDQSSSTSTEPEKTRRAPSVGFGILMLVLLGPIVVSLVVAIINGSITSASSLCVAAACIFIGTAVITHFFFGHRVTWILPMLVVLLGIMGIFAGFYGRRPTYCLFGAMLVVVGLAWKVPDSATDPLERWIVDTRKFLLRSTNRFKQ